MKKVFTQEICPRDDIAAYLDGERAIGHAEAFEAHMGLCRTCRRTLAAHGQIVAALNAFFKNHSGTVVPVRFPNTRCG